MSGQKTLLLGSAGQLGQALEQAKKLGFDLNLTKENIVPVTSEEYGAGYKTKKFFFRCLKNIIAH